MYKLSKSLKNRDISHFKYLYLIFFNLSYLEILIFDVSRIPKDYNSMYFQNLQDLSGLKYYKITYFHTIDLHTFFPFNLEWDFPR